TARRVADGLVPVQVFLWRLIGRVWRGERQVEEQRSLGVVSLDQLDGVCAEQCRDVALLDDRLVVAEPVPASVGRLREVVDLAEQRAVLVIEAALPWPVSRLAWPRCHLPTIAVS